MSAPLVVPASSTTYTGITRTVYRRSIADHLGEYAAMVCTETPSSVTSPDADRQVIALAARGDGEYARGRLAGYWLYVVDGVQAGESRRILEGAHDGPIGSMLVDRAFSAPLASGTTIEITDSLPGGRWQTVKGLNDCVNEALELVPIEVRLDLTGDGTRTLSLSAHPWLTDAEQIAGIYDWVGVSSAAGDPPGLSRSEWSLRRDGADIGLETDWTYASGEAFELGVYLRGRRWIRSGGTWAYSETGMDAESDEAAVPLHWVTAFGCLKALQVMQRLAGKGGLTAMASDAERQARLSEILEMRRKWARACAVIARREFPTPVPQRPPTLVGGAADSTPSNGLYGGVWP